MTTSTQAGLASLPIAAQGHVAELRDALQKSQGANLAALIVYGSAVRGGWVEGASDIDVIVVLRDTGMAQLAALSDPLLVARHRARMEAMILKLDNIAGASDVFPLLYDDIKSCHVLLCGTDPFGPLVVRAEHRRLRVEQELREARIRMRRAIVDAAGSDEAIAGALARKVKQLRGPLHALLGLKGVTCDDTLETVFRESGRVWGVDTAPLLHVQKDPAGAHAAFRNLLDRAVEEADRLELGAAS